MSMSSDATSQLPQQVKVGAAISGGGNRAFTWTLGIFRALSELGYTSKLDAISSVSGGGWFSSLYTFVEGSDSELLGPATEPEELTMAALKKSPAKFGERAVNCSLDMFAFAGQRGPTDWQEFIGKSYLQPFGLDTEAYLAASQDDVDRIKKDNPSLKSAPFQVPRSDRQHTWLAMCTLFSPLDYVPTEDNVVSFMVSMKWTGLAGYPNNAMVSYAPLEGHSKNLPRLDGGGFVETFAFGGDAPLHKYPLTEGKVEQEEVGAPKTPFTLTDVIGISSQALGGKLAGTKSGQKKTPRAKYWPVPSSKFPEQEKELEYQFGDGASIDNSGLLSLLVGGAEKVLWVASSYKPLNMSYTWDDACAEGWNGVFDPLAAGVIDQVIDKFGYGQEVTNVKGGFFMSHNQVFDKASLLPLSCDIWRAVKKGEPAVVSFSEKVLPNAWWNIKGGQTAEVVIFYLEESKEFNGRLPSDTQDELAKGSKGALANFPVYKTQLQNFPQIISYTNAQVNLLSAQGEYSVKQAKDKIAKVLGI